MEEGKCYDFGFSHSNDVNFEHYIEPNLGYMVSITRNSESIQYSFLELGEKE